MSMRVFLERFNCVENTQPEHGQHLTMGWGFGFNKKKKKQAKLQYLAFSVTCSPGDEDG